MLTLSWQKFSETHMKLGTAVVALMGLQPILGLLHHLKFRKNGGRTIISHVHIWLGRALMFLGVINGGMGLRLAKGPKSWKITYGVIAGVVGVAYIASILLGSRKKKTSEREKEITPTLTHETSASP